MGKGRRIGKWWAAMQNSWFHAGNTGHIPNYPRLCSDVFGSMGWRKAQHWGEGI